jgi:hypothetical protein
LSRVSSRDGLGGSTPSSAASSPMKSWSLASSVPSAARQRAMNCSGSNELAIGVFLPGVGQDALLMARLC